MIDGVGTSELAGPALAQFGGMDLAVAGEYHCAGCGYGITIRATLPRCPMCHDETWERIGPPSFAPLE